MKVNIDVIGTKALQNQFRAARRDARKRTSRVVRVTANGIRRRARRTLAANKRTADMFGNFKRDVAKSMQVKVRGTSATLRVDFPAHVIEFGADPFMPPPDALREWAGSKLGDPRAAFPVARAISERGLVATPFLGPAVEEERRPHRRRMTKAVLGMAIFRG